MSGEFCVSIFKRHILRAFKYLDDGFVLIYLYDTSDFVLRAVHDEFYDLIVKCILYAFKSDQRSVDAA